VFEPECQSSFSTSLVSHLCSTLEHCKLVTVIREQSLRNICVRSENYTSYR